MAKHVEKDERRDRELNVGKDLLQQQAIALSSADILVYLIPPPLTEKYPGSGKERGPPGVNTLASYLAVHDDFYC